MARYTPGFFALLLALGLAQSASAQDFANAPYVPLLCGGQPSVDGLADTAGAQNEIDLVGDVNTPAVFSANDGAFFYLRMRLNADPLQGGVLRPAGWGVEFDTDVDLSDYEFLLIADGVGTPELRLDQNIVQQQLNAPADAPEQNIEVYDPLLNTASIAAADSNFGNNADFFLDLAVPLADLEGVGVDITTPLVLIVGTSVDGVALNADLACQDGAQAPTLDAAASDQTDIDPALEFNLRGNGGCSTGNQGGGLASLVLLLFLGCVFLGRRRVWG